MKITAFYTRGPWALTLCLRTNWVNKNYCIRNKRPNSLGPLLGHLLENLPVAVQIIKIAENLIVDIRSSKLEMNQMTPN